jgi:hypothetical protein
MARPVDPEAPYRISVHKIGNYSYASTQPVTVSKDGKRSYRRIHWGKIDGNFRFIPLAPWLLASAEERSKLIFPKEIDLSGAGEIMKSGLPRAEGQHESLLYGDVWLLEKLADETGIRADLDAVFGSDTAAALLTLAVYPMCAHQAFSHLAEWQDVAKAPCGMRLTPDVITRLTQAVTDDDRMALLSLRAGRMKKEELCAVDTTSRNAYGTGISETAWGKNKSGLKLPQTNEAVVYTLTEHMPVWYKTFQGNTPDSRGLKIILRDLDAAGFKDLILITDRGYESVANLEEYIARGQKMIMAVKTGQKDVLGKLAAYEETKYRLHPKSMAFDPDTGLCFEQFEDKYQITEGDQVRDADRMKLNLYLNPAQRTAQLTELEKQIALEEKALEELKASGARLDDDATLGKAYCWHSLEYDPQERILKRYSRNEKKIAKETAQAGFFASRTCGLDMGAMEACRNYRLRDEQEKYFEAMKGLQMSENQDCSTDTGKHGRLLALFCGLVLLSRLTAVRKAKLSREFHDAASLLNAMKPIRWISHPGQKPYCTPFVGAQIKICEAFGFDPPEGCAPKYRTRKSSKGKRGRPPKAKDVKLDPQA